MKLFQWFKSLFKSTDKGTSMSEVNVINADSSAAAATATAALAAPVADETASVVELSPFQKVKAEAEAEIAKLEAFVKHAVSELGADVEAEAVALWQKFKA